MGIVLKGPPRTRTTWEGARLMAQRIWLSLSVRERVARATAEDGLRGLFDRSGRSGPTSPASFARGSFRTSPARGRGYGARLRLREPRRCRSGGRAPIAASMTDASASYGSRCAIGALSISNLAPSSGGLGRSIADFLCDDAGLVMKLEWWQHAERRRDARRDAWLAAHDFYACCVCVLEQRLLTNLEGGADRSFFEVLAPRAHVLGHAFRGGP